jgi:N-acetylglucosaminyl-diphospho-decaprenol L-rhamnosyltransferase
MNASFIDLSVIIVNWNSVGYVKRCLESIYAHTSGLSFEIIVVDNASFDTVDQVISREFPKVRFVQLHENKGFAAANNSGFGIAAGAIMCFLNPDTELTTDAFTPMVRLVKDNRRIGVAGCRLLNSDQSLQTSSVLPFPTIENQIFDLEWLKRHTPQWKLWGMSALYSTRGMPQEVEAISGACLFVPRRIFEMAGGFCEDYFMYSEDVDLCYRIRLAGFTVVYNGAVEIIHHGGKSTARVKESRFGTVRMRKATARYFAKHRSKRYAEWYKRLSFVMALLRLAAIFIAAPLLFFTGRGKTIPGLVAKWLWVAQWSIGF